MAIVLPGDAAYAPGVTQHIVVKISDPAQKRWGFELTPRLASNLSKGQAGDLTSTDRNTQVICDNGRSKPCGSTAPVEFITPPLAVRALGPPGPKPSNSIGRLPAQTRSRGAVCSRKRGQR